MKSKLKPGIIDRYMLRQFVQTFLICFISLTGLYIVFDMFTNLEKFIECAEVHHLGLFSLIVEHYAYRVLDFFDMTAGMLALTAAMFTITWIQRHNEMTALMAAGISRIRVAMPVMIAAAVIALLGTANRELVMPYYRFELLRTPYDLLGEKEMIVIPRMDEATGIFIGGNTVAREQKITGASFMFTEPFTDYCKEITAKEAYYRKAKDGLPTGYHLKQVRLPEEIDEMPSLIADDQPIVITRHDRPDLLEPGECFVTSGMDLNILITNGKYASTPELIRNLHNPSLKLGPHVETDVHSRIVHPFSDLTLLFLGLPLVLTRDNRNVFVAIGFCVAVVSIFVLATMAMQWLAGNFLISPHFAAWAPLFFFIPIAVALGHRMIR